MSQSDLKDLTIKWMDVVLSQSADIWGITIAFLIASVLTIAGLNAAAVQENSNLAQAINALTRKEKRILFYLLYASALFSAASLFFSYLLKGEIIEDLHTIYDHGKWEIPSNYAINSIAQGVLFWIGLALFVAAFGRFRTIVGTALIGAIRG